MTLPELRTKSYPDSYAVLKMLRRLDKDIYMFGGVQGGMSLGSLARDFLDKYGIEIKAHIANRAFISDSHFRGKPIIALEEWQGSKDVAIIIGMADVKAKAAMLKELGFSDLYFLNAFRDFSYLKGCTEGFESFFSAHLGEFEETYSLLADERSREVMKGYLQDRIYNNYDTLARTRDSKGFFSDVLGLGAGEVMLDCGAYDGDTCLEFARLVPQYGHIYALEPDTSLYPKLVSNTRHLRCTPIPKGASDRACTLYFEEEVSGTTHLSHTNEGIKIECDTIDHLLQQERERERERENGLRLQNPISFIKMDIEGAELSALKGAERTIREHKPKLAICVYHRREDLITLPRLILSLNPSYKLFLRNRNPLGEDTILLCVP